MRALEKLARTVLVLLGVFVPLIPTSWYLTSASFFGRVSDLPEYYAASWLILNGRGADIYVLQQIAATENILFPSMSGRVVPIFMAPTASMLIAPLALVPVQLCHYLWCAFLVASIALAVLVIANVFRLSLEQRLLAWIFLCTFGPVFESIRIGQIAPFLLLALGCALYFLAKEPLTRTTPASSVDSPTTGVEPADPSAQTSAGRVEQAGSISQPQAVEAPPAKASARTTAMSSSAPQERALSSFGAACFLALLSCKPQVLIPVMVALAGAGRYRVLFQTLVFIVALALVSLILIGPTGWQNYVSLLSGCFNEMSIMHADQNPTLRGQLLRLLTDSSQRSLVALVSGCAYLLALGAIFLINRRFRESGGSKETSITQAGGALPALRDGGDWLVVMVLTCPLGLVCSQYLMTYDVLLLVPALAIFARKKLYARLSPFVVLPAVFLGVVYMLPFYSFVHYGWILKGALWNPFFFALLYWALLLAVTAFRFTDRWMKSAVD